MLNDLYETIAKHIENKIGHKHRFVVKCRPPSTIMIYDTIFVLRDSSDSFIPFETIILEINLKEMKVYNAWLQFEILIDINRIKSVLLGEANRLGKTEKEFLNALLEYWKTISSLVQRQEHGAEREKKDLLWEDGRRVVFQTLIVMYEVDRALSR